MPVAALYDIHGNLPALEAVLKEIEQLQVERIVFGGDVVLGPMSGECLDLIMNLSLPVHCIKGNCEVSVLNRMNQRAEENIPKAVLEDIQWTAEQLLPEHHKLISGWTETIQIEIEGLGQILFCHATPISITHNFTRLTPDQEISSHFTNPDVQLVVCGHTHMQFDRYVGNIRVVNAGSVGMPFGKPGAYWLLLGPGIEFKHTGYDLIIAADRISNTNYPHAKNFAENQVLNPPGEESMLKVLTNS